MGPFGVMLYPTLPVAAPRHNDNILRIWDAGITGIFNALEMPSTAVPLGLNGQALPIGMQIVGPRGKDNLTIGVAMKLEEAGLAQWIAPRADAR